MALFVPGTTTKLGDRLQMGRPLPRPPWGEGSAEGDTETVPALLAFLLERCQDPSLAVFILPASLGANWEQKGCPGDEKRGQEKGRVSPR